MATRRLTSSKVETGTTGAWTNKAEDTYTYDQAGNIQRIVGTSNGAVDQTECFTYDYLRRLTAAWSEGTPPCDIGPGLSAGVDPYRRSWTFDDTPPDANGVIKTAGLRATETAYNPDGSVLYQSTYAYGGTGKPKHSLASVTTTGVGAGTATYDYDPVGNTTSRPGPGGAQQTLTWDPEGHLAKVSDSSDTTYLYDADGTRLIRRDPGGYSTLTLTDGTELRANAGGGVAGTRYYGGVATRTANTDTSGNLTGGDTLTWTISDYHGTGTLAVNSVTLQVDRRRSLPYGGPRGTQATGFGNKGFVGGTLDPTGLTHLGAREYDPTTGRFISVDPLFDLSDSQSWNGFAYANNAPVTSSDPSGLIMKAPTDGSCHYVGCKFKTSAGISVSEKLASDGTHQNCINGLICVSKYDAKDFDKLIKVVDAKAKSWKAVDSANLSFAQTLTVVNQACVSDRSLCDYQFMSDVHDSAAALTDAMNADIAKTAAGLTAQYVLHKTLQMWLTRASCGVGPAPERPGGESFSPDTPVLMGDGSTKPIKEIEPGDSITATDPESHTTAAKPVMQFHKNHDLDLAELTVKDLATSTTHVIHTTWHHKIWDATTKQWTEVKDLPAGDQLLSAPGHEVRVVGLQLRVGAGWMYDLTVDDIHAYYVLAGDTPVLVHNDNGGIDFSNATLWQGGRFPVGGALDAGGPPNGILYRTQDGVISNYAVYDADGIILRRVDLVGGAHPGADGRLVPTPHVQEFTPNETPDGRIYPQQSKIATPAGPGDLPRVGC